MISGSSRRPSAGLARRRIAAVVLALLGIAAVLIEALRATHRRPPIFFSNGSVAEAPIGDAPSVRFLDLSTGTRVEPGNRVRLLLNGNDTYPALWDDLEQARSTIDVQMYYALPGRVSDTLAFILCDRARHGVEVRLLLDAFGAEEMPRSWGERMRRCGVQLALLRPLEWFTIHSATARSHVRAVVVDGRVGYTGGFGLADYWLGDGHHPNEWRETNIRMEGPVVDALRVAFAEGWAESTGERIAGERFFAGAAVPPESGATVDAGLLFARPSAGTTSAEIFLTFAIRRARTRLYITNSYFVPNADFRRLLIDAAKRGVDVRVLTVGPLSDVKTPWLAGRAVYDELHAHGVRVYEYQPTMMHAKTIVVDGVWSTVGSMNFDAHSLALNDESNVVVLDTAFGARMESVFLDDLLHSKEMTTDALAHRSLWQRALERGAAILSRIL